MRGRVLLAPLKALRAAKPIVLARKQLRRLGLEDRLDHAIQFQCVYLRLPAGLPDRLL
jgi:hypothetical protein